MGEYKIWTCDLPFRIRTLCHAELILHLRTQIAIPTRHKHRYLQRKEIMKNLWNIKVHIYGSEAPSEPPQNP